MSPKEYSNFYIIPILLLLFFITSSGFGFEVNKYFSDSSLQFQEKLNFAFKFAEQQNNFKKIWIVYQIKSDPAVSYSKLSLKRENSEGKTLNELIREKSDNNQNKISKQSITTQAKLIKNPFEIETSFEQEAIEPPRKETTMAIIFDCSLESGRPRIYQIFFQSMDKIFVNKDRPIFWLGEISTFDSIEELKSLFFNSNYEKFQHQIIRTLAIHPEEIQYISFAKYILKNTYPHSIKNEAISWLGKKESIQSIKLLTNIAFKIQTTEVRKKAIQSLAQMDNYIAHAAVRILARDGSDPEIRKEAIFWLSQISNNQSIQTLNKIVIGEKDPDIQEYAVFAISQIPNDRGKPLLSKLAQLSPLPRIREKAIFWLGQPDGQKEIELLIDVMNGIDN